MYASSMTTRTSSGTRSRNRSSSALPTAVPVGLFGLQTKISVVLSVIAAAIASRSWTSPSVSGTWTEVAPEICVMIGYASNDRHA